MATLPESKPVSPQQPTAHAAPPASPGARRALLAINLVLVGVVVALGWADIASAQARARARGEYTMVAGRIQGGSSNVAYLIDAANQEMIALRWNENAKGLEGLGFRDLLADSQASPGR